MTITYTYEIFSVDQAARCMEVVYTSEGKPTLHIGARLPYEGETLKSVVEMYAPIRYWEELETPVVAVEVGQSGTIDPQQFNATRIAAGVISARNASLAASDWTQLADSPLSTEQKAAWAAYRQQLRDIPSQSGFPDNVIWPIKSGILVTSI